MPRPAQAEAMAGLESHLQPASGSAKGLIEYTRGEGDNVEKKELSLVEQHRLRRATTHCWAHELVCLQALQHLILLG